jgi:hypothetical protein
MFVRKLSDAQATDFLSRTWDIASKYATDARKIIRRWRTPEPVQFQLNI